MADTIREGIIKDFLLRLTDWIVGNGFNIPCGQSVYRAVQNIDEDNLPACILYPQIETVEQEYGLNVCKMVFKIEALAVAGRDNKSIVQEQLLGDAIKIMTDPDEIISQLIEEILYTEGGPSGLQKTEENITAIYADFSIKYITKAGDPYHQ